MNEAVIVKGLTKSYGEKHKTVECDCVRAVG